MLVFTKSTGCSRSPARRAPTASAFSQELYNLGHRENFFYLQHAMGLASSIGLGLAMHLPGERVVVLDGDGSGA